MNETARNEENRTSWGRWIALRVAAVLIGLAPFAVVELGLRVFGWQPQSSRVDPYVGFHDVKPLFDRSEDSERLSIPKWRQEFFEPESFVAEKPENEFRIFCLGGSTVQGRPYSIATSFSTWLELTLNAADDSHAWEVINCGGVSYASYRLTPILQECLGYEPDLFIIYTGHNEFLEDRSYKGLKRPNPLLLATHQLGSNLRLYQWALTFGEAPERPTTLPQEVDALLDYRGGLENYHRDPVWRDQVVQHYGVNVRRMIKIARDAGVPLLLVNPVSNLRDCPPFKLETPSTWTKTQREEFENRLTLAHETAQADPAAAIQPFREALQDDPEHAGAWFLLGHCYAAVGEYAEAQSAFLKAKDFDVCPLRMTEPLHAELRSAAASTNTPLVDARAWFTDKAENHLIGDRQLIDHVHPRIVGHQAIAQLLFQEMVARGYAEESPDWKERRQASYRDHFRNHINEAYMARGQQKLAGLKRWAAGRAFKVRD